MLWWVCCWRPELILLQLLMARHRSTWPRRLITLTYWAHWLQPSPHELLADNGILYKKTLIFRRRYVCNFVSKFISALVIPVVLLYSLLTPKLLALNIDEIIAPCNFALFSNSWKSQSKGCALAFLQCCRYRCCCWRECWIFLGWPGLRVGSCLALVLIHRNEPIELSQWPCHDNSIMNIGIVLLLILLLLLLLFLLGVLLVVMLNYGGSVVRVFWQAVNDKLLTLNGKGRIPLGELVGN